MYAGGRAYAFEGREARAPEGIACSNAVELEGAPGDQRP